MNDDMISRIVNEVLEELTRATAKFGEMRSSHEGYGIILEELDEAWSEIKCNDTDRACEEMIQVAAMAIRFIYDLRNNA